VPELLAALKSWSPHGGGPLECWEDREEEADLIARAETEPGPAGPVGADGSGVAALRKDRDALLPPEDVGARTEYDARAIAADRARAALALPRLKQMPESHGKANRSTQ
jgi:hypothetical protein